MKSKKTIFIVLIIILLIGGYAISKKLPKELNPRDVKEISINSLSSNEAIILTADENEAQISEIINRFNQYKMHEDQKCSTTHPISGRIIFNDDSELSFLVGVGNFVTVSYKGKQYNIVNQEFNDYIEHIVSVKE